MEKARRALAPIIAHVSQAVLKGKKGANNRQSKPRVKIVSDSGDSDCSTEWEEEKDVDLDKAAARIDGGENDHPESPAVPRSEVFNSLMLFERDLELVGAITGAGCSAEMAEAIRKRAAALQASLPVVLLDQDGVDHVERIQALLSEADAVRNAAAQSRHHIQAEADKKVRSALSMCSVLAS
jgi:hypothetical protein